MFDCSTSRICIPSNIAALLFWNKYFAQWLEHCWKCAIVPSGLFYPKVINCPCFISRNLQGTSDSWAFTVAMGLLSLAISTHPSMLFSTENRDKTYWGNTVLKLLGSFTVFPLWCMLGTTTRGDHWFRFCGLSNTGSTLFLVCPRNPKWKALTVILIGVLQCLTMLNNGSTVASVLTFWLVWLILNKLLLWLWTSERS